MRGSEGSFHEKQSAMPRTAGVSGNVPEERDIKKRVARWTARKINGNYLLKYSILSSISLPKSLPVCFRFVIGNESDSAALLLLLGLAQKLGQCLIDVVS